MPAKMSDFWDLPGGPVVKNRPYNAGDASLIPAGDPTCCKTTKPTLQLLSLKAITRDFVHHEERPHVRQ